MYNQSMFGAKKQEKCHIVSSENSCFYSRGKLQYIAWACYCNGMQKAAIGRINDGLDWGSQKSLIVKIFAP